MSGYLQRLATSAARPDRRVQPLVGGLYARQPEQTIEEVATTIVPRTAAASRHGTSDASHRPEAAVRAAEGRILSGEPRMEETTVRGALVELPTAPTAEEPRRRSLSTLAEQDSVFASQREEHIERAESPLRRTEAATTPDLLVALKRFIASPTDSQSDASTNVQPLAGEFSGSAEDSEPLRAASLLPVNAGPMRTFARPPAARPQGPSVHSGSDDIQIHIGRIEVIAVPQQIAPRPVAAPARRGPSLEEYLQRRDRRSR